MIADHERRLRYCEGGFPAPHAWVMINGKVIDVTREAANRTLKRQRITTIEGEYMGVVISRRRMLNHIKRTKWFNSWSILTGSQESMTPFERICTGTVAFVYIREIVKYSY
jgi:hypothetical protein